MTPLRHRCGCTSGAGGVGRHVGAGVVQGRTQRRDGGPGGVRAAGAAGVAQAPLGVPSLGCAAGSFSEQDCAIAPQRALLTTRAGRWATRRAGRGEAIADTAAVLDCGWHTVNASVRRWGQALLDAYADRIAAVVALGLDETRSAAGAASLSAPGAPASSRSRGASLSTWCQAAPPMGLPAGCCGDHRAGWQRCAGRCWTSLALPHRL